MKKKLKLLLISLLVFGLGISQISADDEDELVPGTIISEDTDVNIDSEGKIKSDKITDDEGNTYTYNTVQYSYDLTDNSGKTVSGSAFCMDPDKAAPDFNKNFTIVSKLDGSHEGDSVYLNIINSKADYDVISLAVRMYEHGELGDGITGKKSDAIADLYNGTGSLTDAQLAADAKTLVEDAMKNADSTLKDPNGEKDKNGVPKNAKNVKYTKKTAVCSDEDCDSAGTTITYTSPGKVDGAIVEAQNAQGQTQRFMLMTTGASVSSTVTTPGGGGCENPQCGEPDFNVPNICEDGQDPDENGNVNYTYEEDLGNIYKCIVQNKDIVGNSYEYTKDAGVTNNPYCKVYCKESYNFNLPYKRTTDNGRYFQIGAAIDGSMDCYSTKLKTCKYNTKLLELHQQLAEAYNNWMMYYELVHRMEKGRWEKVQDLMCKKTTCTQHCGKYSCWCSSGTTSVDSGADEYKLAFKEESYFVSVELAGGPDTPGVPQTVVVKKGTAAEAGIADKHFGFIISNNPGSCSGCSPTGYTCSAKDAEVDYSEQLDGFKAGLESNSKAIDSLKEEIKRHMKLYNTCMSDGDEIEDKRYTAEWHVNMLFDPYISFTYYEPILENYKWAEDLQLEKIDGSGPGETDTNRYKAIDEATYTGADSGGPTYKDTVYQKCELSGEVWTCDDNTYDVSDLLYIHKGAAASAKYDTPRIFYSVHDKGDIVIGNKVADSELVDGLPVALSTPKGIYFFKLTLDKIGNYFQSGGGLGRIFGQISSRVRSTAGIPGGSDTIETNEYACSYTVSSDRCVVTQPDGTEIEIDLTGKCKYGEDREECIKRECHIPEGNYCVKFKGEYYTCSTIKWDSSCTKWDSRKKAIENSKTNYNCCPNCKVFCVGQCSYDYDKDNNGGVQAEFRTITPANINPNNRRLGYNWNPYNSETTTTNPDKTIANNPNKLAAKKAMDTINEIETRAKSAYNTAEDEKKATENNYTLKVHMTSSMVKWIKEYNRGIKSTESDSKTVNSKSVKITYNDDSLTCEGTTIEGKEYENIFCYSSFIDKLLSEFPESNKDKSSQGYAIAPNRDKAKSALSKGGSANDTLTNDYWTVYKFTDLDVNGDNIPDIGPSWK